VLAGRKWLVVGSKKGGKGEQTLPRAVQLKRETCTDPGRRGKGKRSCGGAQRMPDSRKSGVASKMRGKKTNKGGA